ncbi:MAG: hypothetical protein EA375_02050 [Acholeplasmataceae bacterium]|nr:MAG: hypothetical protein EA375_02050 [Acholeplasmataceae bacterium]
MKKIITLIVFLSSVILMAGCGGRTEDITLPDLTGMTRVEAVNVLIGLRLRVTTEDILDNDRPEGSFSHYGEGLQTGDTVPASTQVIVYFVIHDPIDGIRLPDLTGMDEDDILDILLELDLFIALASKPDNDLPIGVFAGYQDHEVGDVVPFGTHLTVYLAIEEGFIISKYIHGEGWNRAIELYNASDDTIDLSQYQIDLYLNGAATPSRTIPLTGTLAPEQVFLIAHSDSEATLRNKADLTSSDLVHDGNDVIAISYQGTRIVDIIGNIGWSFFYLNNETFVRKPHIVQGSVSYNQLDWDIYAFDNHTMFGSHPVEWPTTFTYNPDHLALDYFTVNIGMILVLYGFANDGDTSTFFVDHLPDFDFVGPDRVRFVGIDTPEMHPWPPEPWAQEATDFVRGLLENATEIYLQRDPASGLQETYGRYLALIWVDGVLLNVEVVRMGFSPNNYSDPDQTLVFNGVSLDRWFYWAEQEAKANNRGIWS